MNFLTGYRTYILILITMAPAIYDAIVAGLASGQNWITILGGVGAMIFRYLATKPV